MFLVFKDEQTNLNPTKSTAIQHNQLLYMTLNKKDLSVNYIINLPNKQKRSFFKTNRIKSLGHSQYQRHLSTFCKFVTCNCELQLGLLFQCDTKIKKLNLQRLT